MCIHKYKETPIYNLEERGKENIYKEGGVRAVWPSLASSKIDGDCLK